MNLSDKESLISRGAKYYEEIYDIDNINIEEGKTYMFILRRNIDSGTRGISRDTNVFVIFETSTLARYYFTLFADKLNDLGLIKDISIKNLSVTI